MQNMASFEVIEHPQDTCKARIDRAGRLHALGHECGALTTQALKIRGAPGMPRSKFVLMPCCENHIKLFMEEAKQTAPPIIANEGPAPPHVPLCEDCGRAHLGDCDIGPRKVF